MDKPGLRTHAKKLLTSYSAVRKHEIEQAIHTRLFESQLWKEADTIGVTIAQDHEWSTTPIIERAWEEGKRIVVPKCLPREKQLDFYHLEHNGQLECVYVGLLEPNPGQSVYVEKHEIDLLLVPGLLFDAEGFRIGHGGGFYDRYLTQYEGVKLSLASQQQIVETLPHESFDIPVDHILTESGFIL
ncbi:5-formyltetrahydrofolate cyclo-ligase [Thalassobacillus sp. CUG 92003]|uniref:5-formyltetrahydrofolate cyclo-ligase n=1 Tax=Thalassobacillus sp. CUG 92003 TaxID=2736641 RepID=UPI0015E7C5E2|nr:5-formyltetrahydrofolate cyclo-ligase [Thalassobacillus sp. CUG 92003]